MRKGCGRLEARVKVLKVLGWLGMAALILWIVTSCTQLGLNYASLETANKDAPEPEIAAQTLAEWEAGREALKARFEDVLYGPWPEGLPMVTLICLLT